MPIRVRCHIIIMHAKLRATQKCSVILGSYHLLLVGGHLSVIAGRQFFLAPPFTHGKKQNGFVMALPQYHMVYKLVKMSSTDPPWWPKGLLKLQ